MFTPVDAVEEQDDGLVGAVKRAGSAALDFLRRRPRANVAEANDVARRAHLGSIAPQLPDIPAGGTFEAPAESYELLTRERRAAPATWGQTTASLPGRAGAALKKGFTDFSAMNEALRADNLRESGMTEVAEMYPQSPAGRATLETLAGARKAEDAAVEAEQWLNAARPVGKESFLQKAVGGAAESSLSNYLPMAAGIATGSVPAALLFQALGMAPPVVGGTFREAKKLSPDISNDDALRAGVRALGAELVGEAAPVGVALRKGMGPIKRILATAGTEGLEEGVTSPLQSLNAKLSYNPNLTLEEAINDAMLSMASGAIAGGPMGAVGGVRTAYDARPQPAPTVAFRPTPDTAEALSRAAPPQDRMQPVREMLQPNQEQRATVPVAESQAPAARAGDGGAALARDGGAPDLQQIAALSDRTIGLGDRINAVRQLVGPQATEEAARSLIEKMDRFEEKNGPGSAVKVISDVRAVYNSAAADRPAYLDMVRGVARDFGGTTDERSVMKSMGGAIGKTLTDYGGDASRLKDALRSTIVSRDVMKFGEILDALRAKGFMVVGNVRNAYADSPSLNGYRDAKINLRLPNGTTTEVQINHPRMIEAKDLAHDKFYKRIQEIEREGNSRGHFTPQMLHEIYAARTRENEIYRAAAEDIIAETRASNSSLDNSTFSGWANSEKTSRFVPSGRNSTGISPYFMENNRPSRSQNKSGYSITTPPSVQIVTQPGQERQAGETDKAYAKRVIDRGLMPADLPEQHERYFNMDSADAVIPVGQLVSTKTAAENEQGGGASPKRMRAAYDGLLGKRDPITVRQRADGRYDVVDGNGTLTGVTAYGWKSLPVRIEDRALGVGDRQAGVFEEGGHRVASTGRVYGAPPSARTPSAERIADSALDYGDTLAERVAQVSWEALPSTKSDVLPGIHAAPLAQQAEYLAAIDQALRDKNGQDEIAKLVGLAGANTVFGFSGWEGKVGEGAQTKTFVATDRPTQGHVVVTDQARSVINLYAAIRGQLLHQDAVAWHFPIYKDSLKASNGVEIRAPGGLTHDQAQALYNEINKLAGHTDYAPIYTETGVRFLNFRDMPNREFHKLIEEAYNIVTNLPNAEFGYFRSDGELISKDKEVSSNGQDYQEVIAAARRPDLQNRIEVLRDRVSAVEARFAEKYGWDKAAGEEATAEQDRAQGVGEASAFYGRNAIDSLEVGSNRADHPAIDYALPRSMGPRRNINPPDSTHRRMLNAAAHDIEAAGFPLRAAMQAVKGVVTYNGSYSHWHAAWLPDHRVVAFSEMRLIEMEGAAARQRYLRGWMAHELTHAIDDAGNGSISSGSPRLDFFVAGDTIVTKGDVVTEVAEAYTKGGKIGEFFEYPLAYAKEFAPALMKEELLAQLSRLYTTNRELMRRELPVSFKMMEDWYAQIQPDSLAATRAGLQAALRAPGAGLGGQERQLYRNDQAVSRADRGVLGVGGSGAGMATGSRPAAGGQVAVTGAQPDLFQSAYSGEKYAVNLNLDRYDTAGAIKGLIEATAKNITDKASRGETATHEKTLAEADRLGISEDQVLAEARKGGKPMSLPEARAYALAVRQLIVTRAEATKHFAEAAFKSGDSQDRAEAMASLYHLAALQAVGMNLSAEAGRLLNSYRILAGVTTGDRMSDAVFDEERQKTAEQVLEQMFGGTNNVDDILARVALMSTQQLASPKMKKALLSRRPSAFLEIWKAGLLSGPQTHIVNMASNMLTSLIRAPETAVAAAIGKLHGGDKVYFRETAALMAGMTAGTAIGARDAWQIIRHGEDANDAGKSETTGKAITGENFGLTGKTGNAVDVAGEVVRTPFRALAAEDALFKGINRTGTLYAMAYRQAIKEGAKNVSMRARELVANPTREMLKAALDDGLYFTFNNQLGAAGQKTLDILHSTKAGRMAQFAVIPFFRTPVNILKFGAHRSPLAPLTQKFQEDIKAGGAKRDMAIARMTTGTAVMSAAFALAASGLLTGGGEPEKERKAADRLAGWRPYSIRVGDKFFEYRRLEPLGMLLGMAADLYELSDYMSREESEQWLKMTGMAFAQNITSKTFLSGLTNLIKAISEPQQYGDNYIGALTGSFVPGVVGQAARARDPWERDTDPDKNLKGLAYAWDDVKRDIQARIPGQREKLPLRRDALGQPMPLTDSPSMFNPIRTGELRTNDPVAMELANARARVSPAKGVIQNVKLTPEEKEAYGQASGTVARARLERLFASPAYQGLPQFLRDEKISKEMGKARADVRDAIVKGMPAERRVEAKIKQLRR